MDAPETPVPAGFNSSDELWQRRTALRGVVSRHPYTAHKARILALEIDRLIDLVSDHGGEEEFLFWLRAQAANRVTLQHLCAELSVNYGLMWSWLSAKPERLASYEAGLRGAADSYVAETVGLSDVADPVTVNVQKLRISTRLNAARSYDKRRFGNDEPQSAPPPGSAPIGAIQITFVDARDGRPAITVDQDEAA